MRRCHQQKKRMLELVVCVVKNDGMTCGPSAKTKISKDLRKNSKIGLWTLFKAIYSLPKSGVYFI